jgi:hypothetical protein
VRDLSSAGTSGNQFGRWDSYASITYVLSSPCSAVMVSFSPATSTTIGSSVSVTAHAYSCTSPQYAFWVLPPGGTAYQLVQSYSSSPSMTWTTAGKTHGVYTFATWVRDASTTGAYGNQFGRWDAYSFNGYTVISPCTSLALSFSPSSPSRLGTTVTVTAHAAGCATPQYEFWVLPPGGSAYQLVQTYSGNGTLTWSTAGKSRGAYAFSIWARDASSAGVGGNQFGRWDTYTSAQYTLSSAP